MQALLEQCADAFLLMWGRLPGPGEAEALLSDAPPGRSAADKYLVGIFAQATDLVGVLELVPGYPGEGDWWIGLVLLRPDHRGRGLGLEVVEEVARWIVAEGGCSVWLCVQEQNPRARVFWQRMGFEEVRRERQHLGRRENVVVVMRWELEGGRVDPKQRSDGT